MIHLSLLFACMQPVHLQADFGNAYEEAMADQADRTRPEVAQLELQINGVEGLQIRAQVAAEVSDAETNQAEYVNED